MASLERTLSIIKPDAVERGETGQILAMIEESSLRVVALAMLHLSVERARDFYDVHKDRPFYESLVKFMTSGPVVVSVLEGQGAIENYRTLMGPTDSQEAPPGTIRGNFGTDIERNAVHGSDSPVTASVEIDFFFELHNS